MSLTPEQQAENIECLRAIMRGERVEFRSNPSGDWEETMVTSYMECWEHRRIPTPPPPEIIPWEMDDVPMFCWFKFKSGQGTSHFLATIIGEASIRIGVNDYGYLEIMGLFIHSIDRENWHPCGKPKS